jgi:integrase/recombinase XerD
MRGQLMTIRETDVSARANVYWREVLDAFLNTLDSPATQREYRRDVESAMGVVGDLDTLTAVALAQYRDRCVARLADNSSAHLSPTSVVRHLAAVRSFLRFARLTGQLHLSDEVIRFVLKSPKATVIKPYQVLAEAEKASLISAAEGCARDRVLLSVILATGLRAAEICALRVGDLVIDEEGDLLLHVRQGKGRKDRIVPLAREAAKQVRAFLAERRIKIGRERDTDEYLFPSRQGDKRMTTARLRQLVDGYLHKAGLNDKVISPHSLRHSAAISWLRSGASVVAVQKLLGHASLSTTQKYVDHLELCDLKEVVNRPSTVSRTRANQA